MKLRHGFKTEAKRLAADIRAELSLAPVAPLDPWALADHLAIPVWTLTDMRQHAPGACDRLLGPCCSDFSAMIATVGLERVIVHNDAHEDPRQRANLTHEFAHVLLFHEAKITGDGWLDSYDDEQEEEAKWLGSLLLVTDEACLKSCRDGLTVEQAADWLGVSVEMMRWRLNSSGAQKRVDRARARR